MENAKITSKGQITIPLTIRKELNLNEGDTITFIKSGNDYLIKNADGVALEQIKQKLGTAADILGLATLDDVAELVRNIAKGYAESEIGETVDGPTALKKLEARYAGN